MLKKSIRAFALVALQVCFLVALCAAGSGGWAGPTVCERTQAVYEANVGVLSAHLLRLQQGLERSEPQEHLLAMTRRTEAHLIHLRQTHGQLCRVTPATEAALTDLENQFQSLQNQVRRKGGLLGVPCRAWRGLTGFFLRRNLDNQARRATAAHIAPPESVRTVRAPASPRRGSPRHAYAGFLDAWQDADDRFARIYGVFKMPDGPEWLP